VRGGLATYSRDPLWPELARPKALETTDEGGLKVLGRPGLGGRSSTILARVVRIRVERRQLCRVRGSSATQGALKILCLATLDASQSLGEVLGLIGGSPCQSIAEMDQASRGGGRTSYSRLASFLRDLSVMFWTTVRIDAATDGTDGRSWVRRAVCGPLKTSGKCLGLQGQRAVSAQGVSRVSYVSPDALDELTLNQA
jgi:hypothetical protein